MVKNKFYLKVSYSKFPLWKHSKKAAVQTSWKYGFSKQIVHYGTRLNIKVQLNRSWWIGYRFSSVQHCFSWGRNECYYREVLVTSIVHCVGIWSMK